MFVILKGDFNKQQAIVSRDDSSSVEVYSHFEGAVSLFKDAY